MHSKLMSMRFLSRYTTEIIGNNSEIVSKINLLPDPNTDTSKIDSTVDNDINEFIEYLQNLRIENTGDLLIGYLNIHAIR